MTVYGNSTAIETFAFLDEGSDLTLVEKDLAKQLGLNGSSQPLCLRWTGNASRMENDSRKIDIELSGVGQQKRYMLSSARTVACLNLPKQSFHAEQATKQFEHLRGIPRRLNLKS